ncbi:MAG: rhomboid family intramembrane serine protease [Parachlamydiaceae bacterium]|nr:rhomboid family intramembrane serine protease [Parachlamydiaceae bacterium]
MRIVCTWNNQKQAQALSSFMTAEGIENRLDMSKESDWGTDTYGDIACHIWIIDEDDIQTANRWIDLFKQNPNNPLFYSHSKLINPELSKILPFKSVNPSRTSLSPIIEPLGKITLYIILLCCLLFLITEFTEPTIISPPPNLPPTPLFSAPLKKQLLYDYPHAYDIVDKLVNIYGIDRLQEPQDLPTEGQLLLTKFHQTPYWQGYYDLLLHHLQGKTSIPEASAPMFERLQQGEYWRLISPCFLHSDILHILFNMIWLIVLGKQLEKRLGIPRYLLFIVLTGVFSNTAQYLMGGPNFIGFSGVICGMLTFIWARQKISAWEGYQLERSTMLFMAFFIISMFSLQLISFYFEANQQSPISPGIANTAHLSGAALGYFLGRLPFFKWKT